MEIQFKLKSITQETATSCTLYLCAILKKEIEDVEYFIMKCKSFHMKYKIGGQGEQHGNKCKLDYVPFDPVMFILANVFGVLG